MSKVDSGDLYREIARHIPQWPSNPPVWYEEWSDWCYFLGKVDKEEQWDENFKVQEFVNNNNKLPKCNTKLGVWCFCRRRDYSKGKLSQENIQALESIPGWSWNNVLVDRFNLNLATLRDFVEQNNKLPSSKSRKNEKKLGLWCTHLRIDYRANKLTKKRIKALELIPGWYWEKDAFNSQRLSSKQINKKENQSIRINSWLVLVQILTTWHDAKRLDNRHRIG